MLKAQLEIIIWYIVSLQEHFFQILNQERSNRLQKNIFVFKLCLLAFNDEVFEDSLEDLFDDWHHADEVELPDVFE